MSNSDVEGYTRQQALQADFYSQTIGRNTLVSNQVGMGTDISAIRQHRNQFLDISYRTEVSRAGFYGAKFDVGREIETILGELEGAYRFDETIQDVWNIMHELSVDHKSVATRGSFVQTLSTFINKANYTFEKFSNYQDVLNEEIKDMVTEVNQLLHAIDNLNGSISIAESAGDRANDLRDERNNHVDRLSQLLNITYRESSTGTLLIMSEGKELISEGRVAQIGLRYTDENTNFVEPVITQAKEILPYNSNVKSLFNYELDISPNRENDRGELKGLLIARGLRPSGYSAASYTMPSYLYPTNILPHNLLDMTNESHATRELYDDYIKDCEQYEKALQTYTYGAAMPKPPALHPDLLSSLSDVNNIDKATEYNTALQPFIDHELEYKISDMKRDLSMERFNMQNCLIPKVQMQLDTLIHSIVTMINDACAPVIWDGANWVQDPEAPKGMDGSQHYEIIVRKSANYRERYDENGVLIGEDPADPGSLYTIGNIMVNPELMLAKNYDKMGFSKSGDESDNTVFEDILTMWDSKFISDNGENFFDVDSYYRHLTTRLATEVSQAESLYSAQLDVVALTDQKRMNVSAVSMDEEMRNMMIFQHAYNASARMVNIIDGMIDKIVNQTGRAGL